MKKKLCLFLAILMCLSFYSCASNDDKISYKDDKISYKDDKISDKKEATEAELAQAATLIKRAEDSIIYASSYQIDGWTTYSSIMEYYFIDSKYQDAQEITISNRAKKIHNLRTDAKENLDKAKELIEKGGDSDYYNAVKEYYKVVNTFWNFISEFPSGYSKYTFSSSVSNYKAKCADAYSEVEFYD